MRLVQGAAFIAMVVTENFPLLETSSLTCNFLNTTKNFPYFVDELFMEFFSKDKLAVGACERIRTTLHNNAAIASGLPLNNAPRHKMILPKFSKLPPRELFTAYCKGTPLIQLSRLRAPFILPRKDLTEHTAIFAPSGHGKTQLLQAIIHDLLKDKPPGMFVLDSHGDFLRNLRPLVPADKLVVLDPESDPPPQLNF